MFGIKMVWLGCQDCFVIILCLIQPASLMQLEGLLYSLRYACPPLRSLWQLPLHEVPSFANLVSIEAIGVGRLRESLKDNRPRYELAPAVIFLQHELVLRDVT